MNIDDMIAEALKEEFEERVEQCAYDTKKHRFSLSYRLWEHKMLRDLKRGRADTRWTVNKARAAVASIIAAAFVLVGGTVYAAVNMGRYYFEPKSEYSRLYIECLPSDKTRIEECYGLSEEGWKIVDRDIFEMVTVIKYENGNKKVNFCQNIIVGNMGQFNTEDTVVEPISLFEEKDGFFIDFKNGDCGLYWIYEGYFFEMFGNIAKDEAINLAYSTKIIDP